MEFLGSTLLTNVLLVIVVLLLAFIANEQTAVARRARYYPVPKKTGFRHRVVP